MLAIAVDLVLAVVAFIALVSYSARPVVDRE